MTEYHCLMAFYEVEQTSKYGEPDNTDLVGVLFACINQTSPITKGR